MTNPTDAPSPVTVIGLGLMGRALAAAFLANGHPTTVWNRTPDKAGELLARGATRAGSVEEAVRASPLVVVCVSDHDAVRELLDLPAGTFADRVVVNLTSGTSTQARETAAWAAQRGLAYVEGVIMAIPPDIATERAVLLYSGPEEAYRAHEATLRSLGPAGTVHLDADHGLSPLYDMSLLGIMWGVLNGFLHGAALLGTAGVPATVFAPLAETMINVVAGYVTAYAPQIDAGEYPAEDATLAVHQGGLRHLAEESEASGVNAELPYFYRELVDRAIAAGHAGSGYAALIEQFRRPSA
ncbi:NAD(P)-dependent oxidoreductase [Streptomyces sp. LS1784]|uniref:NAD(P)-dependent oxidoreductase n=1 Tax=Streptomyces sp. LS1784 TaxID=2851533 RepID=UPI001CCB7C19|nr:NAD(P)-binding domain-containing protein [Streptomyces sp. LS1784]